MPRPYKSVPDAKQEALDALDVLLASGYPGSPEKVRALRELAVAAKGMADQIDQHARSAAA